MKKNLFLWVLLMILASVLYAQTPDKNAYHGCSHIKQFHSIKNTKDIVQSPYLFDYDVKFYFLDIEVSGSSTNIDGEVTIKAQTLVADFDTVAFELLASMEIDGVKVNGTQVSYYRVGDEAFAVIPNPLAEGAVFDINIEYHGNPNSGGFFSGVSNATSAYGDGVTWTLSEPFNARDWWPTKQVLEDKADSSWVFLTTPVDEMAGSEGVLTNVTPIGTDKHRFEWKSKYPIDYYLISFAVSNYQEYNVYAHPAEMNGDSILIQNYIYNHEACLNDNQAGIDQTADFIEVFSDKYYLYPFYDEKYGHCLTELGGGMEHQTMTTLGGFGFDLVSHELGHMWFGDHITCATWSDIWVNEGFATYSTYIAREFIQGQTAADSYMNGIHANVMSDPGGSTFIPADEIYYGNEWRIFNWRLTYAKGAAIIHMMRFETNDDAAFFAGLHDLQETYAMSTATGADFRDTFGESTAIDFTDFFDQWYYGEGYPTYSIVWNQNNDQLIFKSTQTTSSSSTPLFKMTMEYQLHFSDNSDMKFRVYQNTNVQTFTVDIPAGKTIQSIEVDPDNWVLNKVGTIVVGDVEHSNLEVRIFPNPVSNEIHLYFKDLYQHKEVQILDMNGKIIRSENCNSNNMTLDVSQLEKGNYILNIKEDNHTIIKKFVKQ